MFPTLIERLPIVGLPLHTWGVMVALGFALGTYLAREEGARHGVQKSDMTDIALWGLIMGVVGARVLYAVVEWRMYVERPMLLLSPSGGLAWYGGLIAALVTGVVFCRVKKLPTLAVFDASAPGIAVAHALGGGGCLGGGCCWGAHASEGFPLAVRYTDPHSRYVLTMGDSAPVHPAQLYESFALAVIVAVLLVFRRRPHRHGEVMLLYLSLYAAARFVVEFFRADPERGTVEGVLWGSVSTSQFIAMGFAVLCMGWFVWLRRHAPARAPVAAP